MHFVALFSYHFDRGKSAPYIPFRDSKLTSLLKHSLEGNSITLMVACLAPSDLYSEENMNTLSYATMASHIVVKPMVNESRVQRLIRQLRAEVTLLKQQVMIVVCNTNDL